MKKEFVILLAAGALSIGLSWNAGAQQTVRYPVADGGSGDVTATTTRTVTAAGTAGGWSIFRSIDLDETEEEVKGTAGQIGAIWFTNTASSTRWLKCYNATAASVTVGSTTPVITIGLPGNSSDDITGNLSAGGIGVAFGTAITCAATTGVADADTGAPGANEVIVNVFYK